jgi:4'-phosphopantetheinyl transferase
MIEWLLQSMTDLPALPAEAWLSPPERERLATLRVEKKRGEWLLGRWTAKRLAQAVLLGEGQGRIELSHLSITPAPDGAPELHIFVLGEDVAEPGSPMITISHSGGQAFCALATGGGAVGADIEYIAARGPAFAADYFTPAEQELVAEAPAELRDTLTTAVWSAKEAALKALRLGLTVDTRRVECLVPLAGAAGEGWMPFTAACDPSLGGPPGGLRCWWRCLDDVVLTLAAA